MLFYVRYNRSLSWSQTQSNSDSGKNYKPCTVQGKLWLISVRGRTLMICGSQLYMLKISTMFFDDVYSNKPTLNLYFIDFFRKATFFPNVS